MQHITHRHPHLLAEQLHTCVAQTDVKQTGNVMEQINIYIKEQQHTQQLTQTGTEAECTHTNNILSSVFPLLSSVLECCKQTNDIRILNLLWLHLSAACNKNTQLTEIIRQQQQQVQHSQLINDIGYTLTQNLLQPVQDIHTLLQQLSLLPMDCVSSPLPSASVSSLCASLLKSVKVSRFFLFHFVTFLHSFPTQLYAQTQQILNLFISLLSTICAIPVSHLAYRTQVFTYYQPYFHSLLINAIVSLLASNTLTEVQTQPLIRILFPCTTEQLSVYTAAACLYGSCSLMQQADKLPNPVLAVLFYSLTDLLTLISTCDAFLLSHDKQLTDSSSTAKPHTTSASSQPAATTTEDNATTTGGLFDQCAASVFVLLTTLVSRASISSRGESVVVSLDDVLLFLWQHVGDAHPMIWALLHMVWSRATSEWDESFQQHTADMAIELLSMDESQHTEGDRYTEGQSVVIALLATVFPLMKQAQQQRLRQALKLEDKTGQIMIASGGKAAVADSSRDANTAATQSSNQVPGDAAACDPVWLNQARASLVAVRSERQLLSKLIQRHHPIDVAMKDPEEQCSNAAWEQLRGEIELEKSQWSLWQIR